MIQENVPDEPLSPGEKRWHLSARWILDTEQYHEWMSEEDYEVNEQGKKIAHKFRLGVDEFMQSSEEKSKKKSNDKKRKRSPSPQTKITNKRKSGRSPAAFSKGRRVDDEESEDLTKDMDEPASEPNIVEVKPNIAHSFSGPGTPTPKKDPETQPMKVKLVWLHLNLYLLIQSYVLSL